MDRGPSRPDSYQPGTLVVLEPGECRTWSPREGRRILFGRNRPAVHICVGADDAGVSREHGALEFTDGQWQVRTLGGRPVHIGDEKLRQGDDPLPLTEGCTALLVEGVNPRDLHLVRVRVVGAVEQTPHAFDGGTFPFNCFRLEPAERLVMTVIAEDHLRRLRNPRARSTRAAAEKLATVAPDDGWTPKKVEHLVKGLRERLARKGVDGVVPDPGSIGFDDVYRRNLIDVLIGSGTLSAAADLRLLGPDA